ncbi:MAG: hypothetical protein V1494_00120 [Candidatus Diapherotrites archaeon]
MTTITLQEIVLFFFALAFIGLGILLGLFFEWNDALMPSLGTGMSVIFVSFAFFILGAFFYGYAAPFLGLFYGLVKWKAFIEMPFEQTFLAVPIMFALLLGGVAGRMLQKDMEEPKHIENQWKTLAVFAGAVFAIAIIVSMLSLFVFV